MTISNLAFSPSFILQAIAVIWINKFIFTAIYNVFFHPLRNYPGPLLFAISRLPITFGNITGQSALWTVDLHKKYGPVVRMAPGELSYSDSRSWKDIYGSRQTQPGGMPREKAFYENVEDGKGVATIITANDIDHSRFRRAYAKAFSKQALSEQEPLIMKHVALLINKLYEEQNEPIDLASMFAYMIADIAIDLQFGEPLHLLNDITHRSWVSSVPGLARGSGIITTLADFPIIKIIFQLTLSRLVKRARVTYFEWMNTRLDHRLNSGSNQPDIVHFVMEKAGPESSISEAELRANIPVVMFGQTETLTTALSGFMALILDKPNSEILGQLQDEVRSTFQSKSDINAKAMNMMKVLNACINEVLRVYPPVPGALPRVTPNGGAIVSGQWVPGGTRVYTSPLATFRSPKNFHDPDSFHPERWFKETDDKFSMDDKSAWKPYSVGTKDCIGQIMANYVMLLTVCEIMLHFDFELCTESKAWFANQRIWTTWNKRRPLMAKLTPVEARA